jgi:hypothetical protein
MHPSASANGEPVCCLALWSASSVPSPTSSNDQSPRVEVNCSLQRARPNRRWGVFRAVAVLHEAWLDLASLLLGFVELNHDRNAMHHRSLSVPHCNGRTWHHKRPLWQTLIQRWSMEWISYRDGVSRCADLSNAYSSSMVRGCLNFPTLCTGSRIFALASPLGSGSCLLVRASST